MLGKRKIAEVLARAGLHLGVTTVGRMLTEKPSRSATSAAALAIRGADRVVTAKYPGHVWHVDLTIVPTALGFWTSWMPFSLPQRWPYCWWLALVVDHSSRRVMGYTIRKGPPTSNGVRAFLGRTIATAGAAPRHLVCDKGCQFWCKGFKTWCKRQDIKPRFGAVGEHGSLAVIERLILSLKLLLRCLPTVPLRADVFRAKSSWPSTGIMSTDHIVLYVARRPMKCISADIPPTGKLDSSHAGTGHVVPRVLSPGHSSKANQVLRSGLK